MDRRRFLLTSLAGALAAPLAAGAQQAGKVYRIGYLSAGGPAPLNTPDAFKDARRGLGYVEGKNLVIDYRFAEGRFDRLPDLAAELVRLKVDIIVTNPTQATAAAKNATETIPIVMISGSVDPVGLGLVASLARPGGNVTGLSYGASPEIFSKGLELLKETVPKVRRVAILSNPAGPVQPLIIRELNVAAPSLGVQLQLLEVRGPDEFDGAFAAMAKERVGALLVVSDSLFNLHRARLADLAARSRLPTAYGTRDLVEVGGPHVLRAELSRSLPARRRVRGQDSEGRQARRPARRATDEVRAGYQPCVQRKLTCSAGVSPAGVRARAP
jgi:putative ABC transport system substrate-binding protein